MDELSFRRRPARVVPREVPDVPDPDSLRDAMTKRALATKFDAWAEQIAGLLTWASDPSNGEVVYYGRRAWAGPAAERFLAEQQGLRKDLKDLPAAFRQTARNLRRTAEELSRPPNRNT
jgi:uncharacterized protein YukE